MALAGAPRLILFDEPAAGLSPAERRELVALLTSLPAHMSFVLIEHDLDIALRVVERVTVMHNGRVLRHGTPDEIENDAQVQAIYMGRQALMALVPRDRAAGARRRRAARCWCRRPRRLLRPRARAAGRELHARRAACSASSGATAWARPRCATRSPGWCTATRQRAAGRRTDPRPGAEPDHAARHRLRAAGPARVALLSVDETLRLVAPQQARHRPHLHHVPAPGRAQGPRRRAAVGRRAADAGDRPRAAARPAGCW